jgi:hypothetical protein
VSCLPHVPTLYTGEGQQEAERDCVSVSTLDPGVERTLVSLLGFEPRFVGLAACGVVTPTELFSCTSCQSKSQFRKPERD